MHASCSLLRLPLYYNIIITAYLCTTQLSPSSLSSPSSFSLAGKWVLSSLWRWMNNMSVLLSSFLVMTCAQRRFQFLHRVISPFCIVCAPGRKFRQVRLPQSSFVIWSQWMYGSLLWNWHFILALRMWQMLL